MSANTQVTAGLRPPAVLHFVYVAIIGLNSEMWHVCVSLPASVFRLSEGERLSYQLCFLSTFVYHDKTKIVWSLCSIQAAYPTYSHQNSYQAALGKYILTLHCGPDPPNSSYVTVLVVRPNFFVRGPSKESSDLILEIFSMNLYWIS